MKTYTIVDSHRRVVAAVQNLEAMKAVARLFAYTGGCALSWYPVYTPPLVSRSLPPPGEAA